MNFLQIPGQKETISKLIRSVREQRVSHAQIFTGPEGCGSLAVALAFAKYISCENRNEDDSCGICRSCVKYEKMIHPDLHFVFPVIKKGRKDYEPISDTFIGEWREFVSKSPYFTINGWLDSIEVGNAQGLIFSSEAEEIIRKLNLKTFESDYKIMIIWLPEKMHPAAANKLLKLIEEPPDQTIFLLVSDEPDKVIPTILSRCQPLRLPGFTNEEIRDYLADKYTAGSQKAEEAARVANGNIIKAIELFENEDSSLQNLDRFRNLMRFAWKRDVISLQNWSDDISTTGREAQKNFLAYSLAMLRENLMLSLGQKENNIVFLAGEEASFSGNFHPFVNRSNIYFLNDEFNQAFSHVEANGNPRIIFLDLALKVTRLISRTPKV
ncbi:MAG: DNA polymerase III subunit [Bacteroidales bacterium]|nr:DNA polymerase III subunit [Bacteroidales bacterium]